MGYYVERRPDDLYHTSGDSQGNTLVRAIRCEEAHLVELLFQCQANSHLQELGQELPIIVAASKRSIVSKSS